MRSRRHPPARQCGQLLGGVLAGWEHHREVVARDRPCGVLEVEGVAESLAEQLTRLPREAAVGWFLRAWHGVPELPLAPATAQIPSLLGRLLLLGRSYPTICGRQNRLIDPVEVGDGRVCFYVENQSVYRWAFRPGEPDPVVVGQFHDADGWVVERERLSGFLLQVCPFEALFSASYSASASWLPPEALPEVLDPGRLRPVLTPWRWPEDPTVFHASDDAIAMTCQQHRATGTTGFYVMVAAQRPEPLAYLPDVIRRHADRWEHASLGRFIW
jgi:hypothetical protein